MEKVRSWCGQPSDRGRLKVTSVCDSHLKADGPVVDGEPVLRHGKVEELHPSSSLLFHERRPVERVHALRQPVVANRAAVLAESVAEAGRRAAEQQRGEGAGERSVGAVLAAQGVLTPAARLTGARRRATEARQLLQSTLDGVQLPRQRRQTIDEASTICTYNKVIAVKHTN